MIVTLLLLIINFILLCHYLIHHGRFWQLINKIPGPRPLFLIGNILLWCNSSLEDVHKTVEILIKMYYPIGKIWNFHQAFVAVSHPDDVQKILGNSTQHLNKGLIYTFFSPFLETGLLTSERTKWHARRKMLTPTFHFNILKQFTNILIEEGNYMAQCLKDNKELIVNDLYSLINQHTLNVICETAMDISLKDMGEFQQQYLKIVQESTELITARLLKPWFYPDVIFALSPMGRRQTKNIKIMNDFTDRIIAERKQYHKDNNWQYLTQFDNEEIFGARKKSLAMLDLLIAASYNNEINDRGIREEVNTFIVAGHETTTTSLCFTILLLAEHRNIQDHVRSEVSQMMLKYNGKLTTKALNEMKYLEACLKESLRLYPSIPYIFRVASEDVKLQSYIVPSGATLLIPIKMIHRNPEFWPNPDVFDPDRFLPENFQNRHSFSYLPFSAGSRNCIGQRFAMLELKAMIAPLVHNFYLEPVDYLKDLRFRLDLVNRVVNPIRVKFVPIEQAANLI